MATMVSDAPAAAVSTLLSDVLAAATPTDPPLASAPTAPVEAVRRAVAGLRDKAPGAGARDWSHDVREAVIGDLDGLIKDLTVYRGELLVAHREDGRWGSVRDRDFADWRARQTGGGRGAALGEVRLAEGLGAMPQVAGAVERGELTLEHAKTLARTREKASDEVRRALDAGGLDDLVSGARRHGWTAPQLGKQIQVWASSIDAVAAQADFDAVRRRRSLTMRNHGGGIVGDFFLDPVAGAELRTALEAISGRPAAQDVRTPGQRMVDALSEMASRTLLVGSDLTGAQVRPHVSLLINQDTWTAIRARRRTIETTESSLGSQGSGEPGEGSGGRGEVPAGPVASTGGRVPPWPSVASGELEDGTVVPMGELERLMCDCEVTRMVMSSTGIPLDVGRTQRTYTKELRRAATVRDRHCQWPGCQIRASWCEVHHITWFSPGGRTSLAQAISLCSYHHHRTHELDIRITALPDGFDFHFPDRRHLGSTRRHQAPVSRLPDPSTVRGATSVPARVSGLLDDAAMPPGVSPPVGQLPLPVLTETPPPPPLRPAIHPPARPTTGPARAASAARSRRRGDAGPPGSSQRSGVFARPPSHRPEPPEDAADGPAHGIYPSSYATAPSTFWDSDPPF